MATKYTGNQQTGDQGVAFIKYISTQVGCIYRSFEGADIGVDGMIEFIFDNREPSGDIILIQAKSGSSYIHGNNYYIKSDKDHLETWIRYSIPVVGIVYNPESRDARWVNISEYLRKNPEIISQQTHNIKAPEDQIFSEEQFSNFKQAFQKKIELLLREKSPETLPIRAWLPSDARPTRALLMSIANDYPSFYDWLEKQWMNDDVSKKVVEIDGRIAAFSMWKKKDQRNVKIQSFIVGSLFRGTAIGQHLLYNELREISQDPLVQRVFLTISCTKPELLKYFYAFGFRVEGLSIDRYERSGNGTELVLAKHFINKEIGSVEELSKLETILKNNIWGITQGKLDVFGVTSEHFAFPIIIPKIQCIMDLSESTVSSRCSLIDDENQHVIRSYDDYSMMKDFFPLKLYLKNKRYVVVPIRPEFSTKLFATNPGDNTPTPLKLRIDNVYYCTPRLRDLQKGDFVLFYETKSGNGRGVMFGSAVIRDIAIDTPKKVWDKFKELGALTLEDITTKFTRNNETMAIHFDLFEPFSSLVDLVTIQSIMGNEIKFQALTSLTKIQFCAICMEGR